MNDNYSVVSALPGGKVLLARDVKSGKLVILKRGCEEPKEAQIALMLDHENIVKLVDYFQICSLHFLVYEYVEGQDLFSLLKQRSFQPLREDFVKSIFCQLVKVVTYLHQLGICHGDLKLENVMLDSSEKKSYSH